MRAYVDTGKLAGVQWVLSRRGEVVHRDLYGFTDIESETPVAEDTLYRIYSMTKPITSVALMMLYEEGAFLLENPIDRFIPEQADLRGRDGGNAQQRQRRPAPFTVRVTDVHTQPARCHYGINHQTPPATRQTA